MGSLHKSALRVRRLPVAGATPSHARISAPPCHHDGQWHGLRGQFTDAYARAREIRHGRLAEEFDVFDVEGRIWLAVLIVPLDVIGQGATGEETRGSNIFFVG